MKKVFDSFKIRFAGKAFKPNFESLTKQLVEVCFEYVNYDAGNVKQIYIYCSTVFDTIWFNVFYNINGVLLKKHKVGEQYDCSIQKQRALNKEANKIIQKLIDNFKRNDKEVPTEIRITYGTNGKFDCKLSYDEIMKKNSDLDPYSICEEWLESIK